VIKSNVKAAEALILQELRRKNEAAAIAIESEAKRLAPRDTGRLAASITHDSDETGCVVGTNVPYGVHQELGTRYQNGTPFLVPGLMNAKETVRRIYGA
jgi:HK97 gp10 family phage protein